jgi:UPF0755 protein
MSASYAVKGGGKPRLWPKRLLIAASILLFLIVSSVLVIRRTYEQNLKPLSSTEKVQQVTIVSGSSVKEIAKQLEDAGIIRSSWSFEYYVRNNNARDALLAGTYPLSPHQSVQDIVSILTNGKVSTDNVVILPGINLLELKETLLNYGFSEESVDKALDPALYEGHPALVDKPKGASLEGYVFPETFQKTANTDPEEIINAALDELQEVLTPDVRAGIARQGLTIHEGVILASIVEKEAGNEEDKRTIAQVFIKRLNDGIRLESDATASYGAVLKGTIDGLSHIQALSYNSPYNTYRNDGLPPSPISNFTASSLLAVANPSNTDYLYFVADDEGQEKGRSFFSRTLEEHQQLTAEHCKTLCN